MKILGIDPGFERLGIAILEKRKGDKKRSCAFFGMFQNFCQIKF